MLVVQLHPLLSQKLQNLLPMRRGSGTEASTTVLTYSQTSGIALIHCSLGGETMTQAYHPTPNSHPLMSAGQVGLGEAQL